MLRYIQQRVLLAIPNLVLISIIVFFVMRLVPGDPVSAMLAQTPASGEQVDQLKESLGLNDPLVVQYFHFAVDALQGDLGDSIQTKRSVTSEIWSQFPTTLWLTLCGLAVALVMGIPIGIASALKKGSWLDAALMTVALIGVSIPSFWLALIALSVFSFNLGWFPATGIGGWKHMVLPALVLGIGEASIIARMVRTSMVEVLRQEYVVVARAKGLRNRLVVGRHALRNALIPVITALGMEFGYLIGGAVVLETVFARPGIGRLIVDGILERDYPIVQGAVLFVAVLYIVINIVVDVSYAWLDPRIRVN
jgi:ABC-type dipeptide/oligopeptide/nickel transport system permease component